MMMLFFSRRSFLATALAVMAAVMALVMIAEAATLTTVPIDSDNPTSSGMNETATVGDTVTLTFTVDETIPMPTVTFTLGGASAAGSVIIDTPGGNDWSAIDTGGGHTAALKSDGSLWKWGALRYGLQPEKTAKKYIPVQIGSDTDWSAVAPGGSHTVTLKSDGTLWSWGSNGCGQLGIGNYVLNYAPTSTPVQ